eukprot:scaffold22661_cov157-Skeletonema_dohrnii-CCMP3373.AAC.1
MTETPPLRLLTVGDGDISFSLSLKRAYPAISVTASTLVESPTELCKLYNNAAENSAEFVQNCWKEQIIYKVDATNLKETIHDDKKYDMILFNHPHLGDSSLLQSESLAAQRHHSLLAHYFHSAQDILSDGQGRIHVCLSGNQPKTWNVMEAATNCGLKCVSQESTSCPISKWLFPSNGDDCQNYHLAEAKSHYKPPRKFRNGKLGSKHFLARYGYRHRRTEGDLFQGDAKEMNVQESVNFVFAVDDEKTTCNLPVEMDVNTTTCNICRMQFDSNEHLRAHLRTPALPDVSYRSCREENPTKEDRDEKCSSLPTSAPSVSAKPTTMPTTESIDINDATILVEATVEKKHDSKRLKNICRQADFPLSEYIKSKSQCETAIKNGRVFVNRLVAFDTGRLLRENDIVALVKEERNQAAGGGSNDQVANASVIKFVQEIASTQTPGLSIVIANKPVGVRCVGSFASSTLEMKAQKHYECYRGVEKLFCRPLTKLDTGCAGLCALAISPEPIPDLESLNVCYNFTVLVHGQVPETWKDGIYAKVPTKGVRQWKRQKTEDSGADDHDSSTTLSTTAIDLDNAIFINSLDVLSISGAEQQDEHCISTLSVSSCHDEGRMANVIPYILRKLGYPVVCDRFAKREYSRLPRKMKNVLKQKICIGLYSLDIEFERVTQTVATEAHKRTQCEFWRHSLEQVEQSKSSLQV